MSPRRSAVAASVALALTLLTSACATAKADSAGPSGSPAAIDSSAGWSAGSAADLVPDDIRKAGVITVGTSVPSPPFEYFEADGKTFTGVEVDLITTIAKKLGLNVKFVNASWDGLIPALRSGRYDAIAGQIADYTDREKLVTFVNYSKSGAEIIVPVAQKGSYKDLTDVCGKTLGAGAGSDNLSIAQNLSTSCKQQGLAPINIKVFTGGEEDLVAIRSGRIDGVVADQTEAEYLAGTTEGGKVFASVLPGISPDAPMVGIAVPKNSTGLAQAIATELDALIADGTFQAILKQYHVEGIALPKAAINGATKASKAAGS